MAPELLNGERPDSRADLFALGVVIYFCLTGNAPWVGSMMTIAFNAINKDIDLSNLNISAEFREALARLLARNRADRYSDAKEFALAVEQTPEWRRIDRAPTRRIPLPPAPQNPPPYQPTQFS
jgi:serine/threonine protein kinase